MAYLIDPEARTVTEVERGSLDSLAPVYELLQCQDVEGLYLLNAKGDMLYVDEVGLYKPGNQRFFCRLYPTQVLVGRALWIGSNLREGAETPPRASLKYACDHIVWVDADGSMVPPD